jgi:hypothetical protein
MDLKEIMSVSGQGGLFKFVSQARNGIIVESFSDNKRRFVSASTKVSALADIAVFTEDEEVPLKQVFKKISSMDDEVNLPDPGSAPDDLKAFMEKVLPDYDRSRVYASDIKKIVNWYQMLKTHDLLDFKEDEESGEGTGAGEGTAAKADAASADKAKGASADK